MTNETSKSFKRSITLLVILAFVIGCFFGFLLSYML